jgi:Tfp pilus assembly protein PilN
VEKQVVEASSSGRAAPKIKSINVQANLLSQRLTERATLAKVATARVFALVAIVGVAGAVLPVLYGKVSAAQVRASTLEKQLASLKTDVAKAREQSQVALPKIQRIEILQRTMHYDLGFISHLLQVLGSASDDMVIRSIKGEVQGGEMTISAQAESESFEAAQAFLARARQGALAEHVSLNSTRKSDSLGTSGLSFELLKKVTVGQ